MHLTTSIQSNVDIYLDVVPVSYEEMVFWFIIIANSYIAYTIKMHTIFFCCVITWARNELMLYIYPYSLVKFHHIADFFANKNNYDSRLPSTWAYAGWVTSDSYETKIPYKTRGWRMDKLGNYRSRPMCILNSNLVRSRLSIKLINQSLNRFEFCTETAVLYAKYSNYRTTETDIMDERDFAKFEHKMSFGWIIQYCTTACYYMAILGAVVYFQLFANAYRYFLIVSTYSRYLHWQSRQPI